MVSDTTISTVALAIALVALVTTVSQVIGQFLATADGYRRCQPSVMGRWAKLTRRKFRWSEMRFETIYRTPWFGLSQDEPDDLFQPHEFPVSRTTRTMPQLRLDGSIESMKATYCEPSVNISSGPNELVSWVRFIEALHASSWGTVWKMKPAKSASNEKNLWGIVGANPRKLVPSVRLRREGCVLPDLKIQQRSWDFVPPEVVSH